MAHLQRFIPTNLSLSGLIYCFRYFNRHRPPYKVLRRENTENIKNTKDFNIESHDSITNIQPYLRYFNYYNSSLVTTQPKDWELFHSLNYKNKNDILNRYYSDSLMDDIYYELHNGVNDDFNQDIANDSLGRYIDEVFMTMKINAETYIKRSENIKRLFGRSIHNIPLYESIQLDNNEVYNLRLVSLPENTSTSVHNHDGVCFYKLLNYNDSMGSMLREKKYLIYASNIGSVGDENVVSHDIFDGTINVCYPNNYHQLMAYKGHCYSLHLYFHNFNMCV